MKVAKLIIWAALAMITVACQANESKTTTSSTASTAAPKQTEADVRQRIEQMKLVEYQNFDQILSKGLQKELAHAHSIFNINEDDTHVDFEWAPGILDVCGEKEPQVLIDKINIVDQKYAYADMLYVDKPCYEIPYTLCLLWEDGEWKIDDVTYSEQAEGWCTLRDQCSSFYDMMADEYKTGRAQDIIDNMLSMEPIEENYNDPATIYYNNPKELKHLIEQIENGHQFFKKNPGYTPAMGQKLNDMIARIKKHL